MMFKKILSAIFILIASLYCSNNSNNSNSSNSSDCITIRGGGFSGFWYYYGYLQKNNITNKTIYCLSSGCLAYVASIKYLNETYLYELANTLAIEYNNNNITKYELKEKFINIIANSISIENYNLNILTSNYLGQCTIKKPTTVSELIVALDETTNIPIITTKLNFSKNIDGGYCITFINKCTRTITLPYDYRIYSNIFNNKLTYDDVIYFLTYTNL